jgi:hypothetical protein
VFRPEMYSVALHFFSSKRKRESHVPPSLPGALEKCGGKLHR